MTRAKTATHSVAVRPATEADIPAILALLREHADTLGLSGEMRATEAQLRAEFFAREPRVYCDLGEIDGTIAGLTVWFYHFSTFSGRAGIYIEDMYTRPGGVGGLPLAFHRRLAQRCLAENLVRIEWSTQDSNEVAINLFHALGAKVQDGWKTWRWSESALLRLAGATARTDPPS